MIQDTPFVEMEICQLTKTGQSACGDDFRWKRLENENRCIAVLSDGLGSGIKANLLANMTTTMALRFMESNMDILQSAETIMDSLPVCEVRKISYATFSIVDLMGGAGRCRLIEMGNPDYIQLRGTKEVPPFASETLVSEHWPEREMKITELKMELGDRLVICSDGVTQAGLGLPRSKFGWRRQGCLEFCQGMIARDPAISARELSRDIVFNAVSFNPGNRVVDDTSCAVIYLRKPRILRLITGPPFHKDDDARFAAMARGGADTVVICGGTTANIIKRELGTEVKIDLKLMNPDEELPPPGVMRGVGLTTEGILTLTKTAAVLESRDFEHAPVSVREIISRLDDSDIIEFVVGTKVNEAHQDPSLPVDLEIRRNVVRRLKTVLENEYRKKATVQYI